MEGGGDRDEDGQKTLAILKTEHVDTEMVRNFQEDDSLHVGDILYCPIKVDSEVQDSIALDETRENEALLTMEIESVPKVSHKTEIEIENTSVPAITKSVSKPKNSKRVRIKPAICRHCHTGFPSADLYEHHMSTVHKDERPYSCRHCGKPFKTSTQCRNHETIHNPKRFQGEPQYHCDLCSKAYHLKVSLETHRKKKNFGYKAPKKYTETPVLRHYSTKGTKNPNPYRKPKEIFPCPHCDLKFWWRSELQKHLICHQKERPFSCSLCQQAFPRKESLQKHIRNVHENPTSTGIQRPKWQQGQPCPCTVCGKVFSRPSRLRTHMTLHTGEKAHGCSVCGQRFRLRESLTRHKKQSHVNDPLKLYKCVVCGRNDFRKLSDLRQHRRNRHAQIPYETEKDKPFACMICLKPYFLREDAIICAVLGHDPSHLLKAMFKFKCPECPPETFGFRSLSVLRRHWGEEHPDRFLPQKFRNGMYNASLDEDFLPNCKPAMKTVQSWKMNGIPGNILKRESPLYLELLLVPLPEEEEMKKPKKRQIAPEDLKCDLCCIQMTSVGVLKRHKKVVHNPERTENVRKAYQCRYCNKLLYKADTLKAHEETHKHQEGKVISLEADMVIKKEEENGQPDDKYKNLPGLNQDSVINTHCNQDGSQSVNVNDAKAVAKILSHKSMQVSLLKWSFPQGMVDKCREDYGLD